MVDGTGCKKLKSSKRRVPSALSAIE